MAYVFTQITYLLLTLQVKKLRNENDEAARIIALHAAQGVDPPEGLRHDFEDMMRLVGMADVEHLFAVV